MDLEEIKELVDSAEASTSATREEASDMLVFGRISQNDDISASVQTEYRGQFDLIKKNRNRIISELWSNPVSIVYKPRNGADPDAANTLSGMFRSDMQASEEAIETALADQVDCGFGAYRFVTEYESNLDDMNNNQRIRAIPINEANNVVYFDDNCKTKDKSDARWCLIISTFTSNGYKKFAKENGLDPDIKPASFKEPNNSTTWFWRNNTKQIKIGEFYSKEKKRKRVCIFQDPLGDTKAVYQTELADMQSELDYAGFVKIGEKMKDHWVVKKYLVSGDKILKEQVIAGEYIPVVPMYGDWSFVEGRELWRGIYHDAQDYQRLHNFVMQYTVDIVAKGPKEKPIFDPQQIEGFEYMYHQAGADNNYPYLLANSKDADGNPFPIGPAGGYLQNPTVPQGNAALLQATREGVDSVTGGSMNMDSMMNSQVTEGQVVAARSSQNMESFLYQNNFALAQKQAGRIYASIAKEIYDVERDVITTSADGEEHETVVNEQFYDYDTGEDIIKNDMARGSFDVYADTGPAYSTQKERAQATYKELYMSIPQGTPESQLMLLSLLNTLDGESNEHLRSYARKQLVLGGFVEPETEEEVAMASQAQQAAQQPDPNMLLAQAEMEKAQADKMDAQNDAAIVQIDAFNAETNRLKAISGARKDQASIAKTGTEIKGNELDNIQSLAQAFMPSSNRLQ